MATVTVDVRMLRQGSKWCGTARVSAPCLKAPVDLYASKDVQEVVGAMCERVGAELAMSKPAVSQASSATRKGVRHQILGLTYNLFREYDSDLRGVAEYVRSSLDACDRACDMVTMARNGDVRARTKVEEIFAKAKGGDQKAFKSAKMLNVATDLLDDGRAAIRISFGPPDETSGSKRAVLKALSDRGHGGYAGAPQQRAAQQLEARRTARQLEAMAGVSTAGVSSAIPLTRREVVMEDDAQNEYAGGEDGRQSDRKGDGFFANYRPEVAY